MIDVHSHVFNPGYVPGQDILELRGLGTDVARLVVRLLLDAFERDEELPSALVDARSASGPTGLRQIV